MCLCKGEKARDIQGSVFILLLSIDRILCSLLSQWNISCFFFSLPESIRTQPVRITGVYPLKGKAFWFFLPLFHT